ncbi:Gfo/Idh/MocA family oxidoreductase [Halolamina sp. CBA1230]|uniref:Gfo/Idh/MocA family protein n=1 Tax=Halolamina sp. CBA1230 TaxID=1853690 RepID=UPI0009A1CAD4|nr:Gfo/Idh/MocA family oxidoreductase [Halolamina sp. CBA1230]QKY21471.1 Gfo/Idh/MocA family oxidoreductase [Halolamina sp. CBA1230]
MSDPLSVGMLGYGFMGKAHANALARLPMFVPDAPAVERDVLVGRDEAALAEAADRLGFARTATDWRDVVDEVDVFYNLGPNHVHPEPTIAALEAGTAVLCEKPMAPTLEDAERMAAAASDTDSPAAVGFNYRYVPAIQYAKRLIDAGELGDIRQFRGRYLQDWLVDSEAPASWRTDAERAGSGALGDLGAHTVDLVRYLVGDIERVSGQTTTFVDERPAADGEGSEPVTVDDAFSAQVRFESGAAGTLEASRVAVGRKNDHTIEIEGTEGALRFSLERLNELELYRPGNRGFETVLVTEEDDPFLENWWPPGHVLGWEHTFVHENQAFLAAVDDGEPYAPAFVDGLAVQRVLDAVERSADAGEEVGVR